MLWQAIGDVMPTRFITHPNMITGFYTGVMSSEPIGMMLIPRPESLRGMSELQSLQNTCVKNCASGTL